MLKYNSNPFFSLYQHLFNWTYSRRNNEDQNLVPQTQKENWLKTNQDWVLQKFCSHLSTLVFVPASHDDAGHQLQHE